MQEQQESFTWNSYGAYHGQEKVDGNKSETEMKWA